MKRVHIITGGSSGIGFECAKKFTQGKVLITARNEDALKEASLELEKYGVDVDYKTSDITSEESLKELFEYAKSIGSIQTVLNSAGVSGIGGRTELTFNIDLLGSANLVEIAKDYMAEESVLILIASMMGYTVPDEEELNELLTHPLEKGALDKLVEIVEEDSNLAYNYSKKGVQLLVRENALEYGRRGIRIVSVSPGIILTPMAEKASVDHKEQMALMREMTPVQRNGRPEDVANMVEFVASEKASFVSGVDLLVDGGLSLYLPELMTKF